MKQLFRRGALALVLVLGLCTQGFAEDGTLAAPPARRVQELSLTGVERSVRDSNPTVRSLQATVASIGSSSLGAGFAAQSAQLTAQIDSYQKLIDSMQSAAGSTSDTALQQTYASHIAVMQGNVASLQGTLASLPTRQMMTQTQIDDARATLQRQTDNVANQLAMGAQSALITMQSLKYSAAGLTRTIAALDRQLGVLDTQLARGMVSRLQVDTLRRQRESLATTLSSLQNQQENLGGQLALLCGYGAETLVRPSALPLVTDKQIRAMRYDSDAALALQNSFTVWTKQVDVWNTSNKKDDSIRSSVDALESAQTALAAERESVGVRFRAAYDAVAVKQTAISAQQAAADKAARDLMVARVQYARGALPQLAYLQVKDTADSAADAVETAKIDLISAYNRYEWAKRGLLTANA